jgi:hypothetical protein
MGVWWMGSGAPDMIMDPVTRLVAEVRPRPLTKLARGKRAGGFSGVIQLMFLNMAGRVERVGSKANLKPISGGNEPNKANFGKASKGGQTPWNVRLDPVGGVVQIGFVRNCSQYTGFCRRWSLRFERYRMFSATCWVRSVIITFLGNAIWPRRNTDINGWEKLKFLWPEIFIATLCACRPGIFDQKNNEALVFSGLEGKINRKVA